MDNIAAKVDKMFCDSLYASPEIAENERNGGPAIPEGCVMVEGLRGKFGFHPGRLASHREDIISVLREMNPGFHEKTGGGWSFLNLCADKDGNQWGEHRNGEQLVSLAIGSGLGSYCLPREMWNVLPGGVPYIAFSVPEPATA